MKEKTNVVPYYTSMLIIGAMLGGGWVTFSLQDQRIAQLEKKVDMFQKIWENVPEEYRQVVAP